MYLYSSFSTGSLAVVSSLFFFLRTLRVPLCGTLLLRSSFHTSNITAWYKPVDPCAFTHVPLCDRWFAAGASVTSSLKFTTKCSAVLSVFFFSCPISSTASWFRGHTHHCAVRPVDSCVCTHAPLRDPLIVRHCWVVFESRVFCICHTILPFTCADDFCILFLSCTRARFPTF